MYEDLKKNIRKLLLTEIRGIALNVRANMQVVEEKENGDSATVADLKIGELLHDRLTKWLPNSLVVEEEHFDKSVYDKIATARYIWVVDPIDGTKAFRTADNNEYCIAIALLDDFKPILSFVYAPEGDLFEADENGATINGKPIEFGAENGTLQCVNHVHRDTVLNEQEEKVSTMCEKREMIRAYEGHSTLIQLCLVAAECDRRVFTRRGANIWDIVQGAYIVVRAGGCVFYEDGTDIFPIDFEKLVFSGEHLLMPYIVACNKEFKRRYIHARENPEHT